MVRWIQVAALVMAGAMGVQAQMRGFGGAPPSPEEMVQARVERLSQWLSLSDSQKTQALKIFTDAQAAVQPYRQQMAAARQALQAAVKANDAAGLDRASRDIGAATAEITLIESRAEASFYALLTPEQKQKYDQMPGRGLGMGGGIGPGPARPGGRMRPQQ
jgi:Spy/CpxP family protein refolding chaperone